MLVLQVMILVVGFAALIRGADLFVDGSSALAKNFRVPSLLIGLTIVALGTSAPELAVSTSAALQGSNEIALSNVVGSNMFNLLAVLGLCALIHPVPVETGILRRDFPVSIGVTALVLVLTGGTSLFSGRFLYMGMEDVAGTVGRMTGLTLLVLFIIYIAALIADAKRHPVPEDEEGLLPIPKCMLRILAGLALIVGGGQAVVYGAKEIARAAGMTETLIGLTIVAVGTSLPELVTSFVAARKGETGLAVGNVVGSNLFNLMFILGISSGLHPIAVNAASVYDLLLLLGASLVTFLFSLSGKQIKRPEGIVLLGIYAVNVVFAVVR